MSAAPVAAAPVPDGPALVLGLGVTGRAVAATLVRSGRPVVVVEDHPRDEHRVEADLLGVTLVDAPTPEHWPELVTGVAVVFPSPGVPDAHPVFAAAQAAGVPVRSELDLAGSLDDRPVVAITGTDGKTTVTEMVTRMVVAGGRRAVAAGNTEVPLVAAIDDPSIEVFVVEASSFRLGHTHRFVPAVATWLNFGPDHQDVHRDLEAYEAAKARLWTDLGPGQVAVANREDPVVMRHLPAGVAVRTFGSTAGDYRVEHGHLVGDEGPILAVDELSRHLPHDVSNALAATATACAAGVDVGAVADVLRDFEHLPHRVQTVAELAGVRWVDDSKATTPHATLAAVAGFASVVLVAGGRNKGVDLAALRAAVPPVRAVVAIGEAAGEVAGVFDGVVPVVTAESMDDAVDRASALARAGDTVLLSPACASFDWYSSYAERGQDFTAAVGRHLAGSRS